MTNDRHVRIRENGAEESLPAIQDMQITLPDPEENAQWKAEYFARNQRVRELLEAKGFGMDGDEPLSIQVNRYLHVNEPEK